jgi:hypothetical protein
MRILKTKLSKFYHSSKITVSGSLKNSSRPSGSRRTVSAIEDVGDGLREEEGESGGSSKGAGSRLTGTTRNGATRQTGRKDAGKGRVGRIIGRGGTTGGLW